MNQLILEVGVNGSKTSSLQITMELVLWEDKVDSLETKANLESIKLSKSMTLMKLKILKVTQSPPLIKLKSTTHRS